MGNDQPTSENGRFVLVIDDEETVRMIALAMLSRMGFQALSAVDGREGVDMFLKHKGAVVAVLLDMVMPNTDGKEVFLEIRRADPTVPIIVCSGHLEEDVMQQLAGERPAGFINKPYRFDDLHAVINDVLGS